MCLKQLKDTPYINTEPCDRVFSKIKKVRVAKWITRSTSNREIVGSTPTTDM
jgi:hypothetical protein